MVEAQNKSKIRRNNKKPKEVNKAASASSQTIACEVTQVGEEEFYRGQPQTAKQINIQRTGCIEEIKPFDATGGFSKKNGKQELDYEQLRADKESLEKRVNDLTELYKKEHPEPKPWYLSFGVWLAIICGIIVIYLCYQFYVSQGGFPREITNFFLWVKYYITGQ